MKKVLAIILLALGVSATGYAQDYKPFQLYFGLGYAAPAEGGGGVLFKLEPAYRVSDQIAVGLRVESAVMGKGLEDVGTGTESNASAVVSYTVNGRYYLGSSSFRPYVGAGFGIYTFGNVSYDGGGGVDETIKLGSKFGFYPRVGFDAGHFNVNLDYNIVSNEGDVKNNYIGVSLGFFLFGGKK